MKNTNLELNKQPLLILIICFILGIFFQDYFCLNRNIIYFIIGGCLLIFLSTFSKSYLLHKTKPCFLGVLFFGIGIVLHFFNSFESQNLMFSKNEIIVFKISKKLNSTEKNKKYEIEAQVGKDNFNAVLYIAKNHRELDFNHYYQAKSYISKPKSPQYDFQFDYSKYLKRKNIEYQCYVNDKISYSIRNDLDINEIFPQKRLKILENINKAKMSSRTKGFLKGIILADRTEMDSDTIKDFNRSGLVHFLAISGTHIVVIFWLFNILLNKILPVQFRYYVIVSSLLFIWLFASFIGFGNSVVRSCIMLSIYFIYVLLQRKPDLLHSLALSAFIILIFDTQQIFDVGFQLSFLAVLGIFWLNQPILKYLPKQDNWFKKIIFNTISISLSAQCATLPLVLYYFHQFSFISIVANFVIVPFSEIIIVFSFLMTIVIGLGLDLTCMNIIFDFTIQLLLKVIHWFSGFDFLFFENIPMNIAEVFSMFLIAYLLRFSILKFNLKNSARLIIAILSFFILKVGFTFYESRKSEVLVHIHSKYKVLSVKRGGDVCFWIDNNSDKDKIKNFIINPYSASRRINRVEVKTFPKYSKKVFYNGKTYDIN